MKLVDALDRLNDVVDDHPADWSGGECAQPRSSKLTWEFLAYGITDHVLESQWHEVDDHVFAWVVRLESGDNVHGRLPKGHDNWVVLIIVDEVSDEAVMLGRDRYCCAMSAGRAAAQEWGATVDEGLDVRARLQDVLPLLREIGF